MEGNNEKFLIDLLEEMDRIKAMLLEKNRKYGDSALNPVRIFSKASPIEQIKDRIDDKLSRISNQQGDEDEDPTRDLIGYLFLLLIAEKRAKTTQFDEVLEGSRNILDRYAVPSQHYDWLQELERDLERGQHD